MQEIESWNFACPNILKRCAWRPNFSHFSWEMTKISTVPVIGGHGGGSTPPRAQNRGPPPWEKTAPPPPGGLGPPKRFGDFWAEARPKLCSSYFLSTFYLILSKLVKNLRLAPHFIIYPYVFININICSQKIALLSPPSPPLGWKIAPPPRGKMRSSPSPEKNSMPMYADRVICSFLQESCLFNTSCIMHTAHCRVKLILTRIH